jgi:dTDP-glucose pyrophosphorylase
MKNLIISKDKSFIDAVKLLNENGNGFLAIVDKHNKLIGILTDGDIRRALLENKTELLEIINRNPLTMPAGSDRQNVLLKMKEIYKKHMPLVDEDNYLKDVIMMHDEDFNLKPNWVVIMAGGIGSRLGKLTNNIPKPMLKVGSKPMLEHIINNFISYGYTNFLISVNYKSHIIKDHFGDGAKYGVDIQYIEEKEKLGTGGSLSLIDFTLKDPFFVINGDILTSIDFEKFHRFHVSNDSNATICTKKNYYKIPYGVLNIDINNTILSIDEKPEFNYLINTGIYMLNPETLKYIPKNHYFDMPTLFKLLREDNLMIKSFEITDYWVDIGYPDDYVSLNNKVSDIESTGFF